MCATEHQIAVQQLARLWILSLGGDGPVDDLPSSSYPTTLHTPHPFAVMPVSKAQVRRV
jgi:hypothetical protein